MCVLGGEGLCEEIPTKLVPINTALGGTHIEQTLMFAGHAEYPEKSCPQNKLVFLPEKKTLMS